MTQIQTGAERPRPGRRGRATQGGARAPRHSRRPAEGGGPAAELLEDPEQRPDEPLLRDPPQPPGYVDPIEESDVLREPFASDAAQPMA
jgi:hypothetical protein